MHKPPIPPKQCAAGLGSDDRTKTDAQHDSESGYLMRLIERRRAHLALADGLAPEALLDLAKNYIATGDAEELVWTLRLALYNLGGLSR